MDIVEFLSERRVKSNMFGASHHACALVPNHIKGNIAKVDNLW